MHGQVDWERETRPGPLGDDWLTRDPESFGELPDPDEGGPAQPGRRQWRGVVEDVLLYGAGITTGLLVVGAAWLLLQLAAPPAVLDGRSPGAEAGALVERVARH